jgi:hypothetical protein
MKRIELTIKVDYLPTWGLWEGVRELVQNARDAEIEHQASLVAFHNGTTNTLTIKNDGVDLPHEALLLGHTTKNERTDTIGKFGEGLKLGVLALVRAGHKVVIHTGREIWKPALVPSTQFEGSTVLAFTIERRPRRTSPQVRVDVCDIDEEAWKDMKRSFLFLSERKDDDTVVTANGTLLLAPRMKGRVHVKGIFVQAKSRLEYGYDMTGDVELDRDRRIVASWDLENRLGAIWNEAVQLRPDLLDPFYKLLEEGKEDVYRFHYSANVSDQVAIQVTDKFQGRFGTDAVPVSNLGDSKTIEHFGKRGIVVSKPLANILHVTLGDIEEVKKKLAEEVVEHFSWGDLSDVERTHLERAVELLDGRCSLNDVDVVRFRSANLLGQYKVGRLLLAKRILDTFKTTLATLVHEVAHNNGGDGEKGHVAALEAIWSDIVIRVLEGGSHGSTH